MYYIYDCNGKIVGNSKGYSTMSRAMAVSNNKRTKAYNDIWNTFYARDEKSNNFVFEVSTHG